MTSYQENLLSQLLIEEGARVINSSIECAGEALAIHSAHRRHTQEE
jgi:hypothetical protein